MDSDFASSVLKISSKDKGNTCVGTGFVIHKDEHWTYLATCAHVVKGVGGPGKIKVGSYMANVTASGSEGSADDLSVLQVEGLKDVRPLKLSTSASSRMTFKAVGFRLLPEGTYLVRPLRGHLGEKVGLEQRDEGYRVNAWDLTIDDDHTLQPGYSGAPVVDEETGFVMGVVSHRQGQGEKGLAISIELLRKIWPDIPFEFYGNEQGRRYACLIGTNQYKDTDTFPSSDYSEEYVDVFARLLESKHAGDFDRVEILKGKSHTDAIRSIRRLCDQLKQDDLLLIYFSGYALFDEDQTKGLHLASRGTIKDEVSYSAISLERIKIYLDDSKAYKKILILDCQYLNKLEEVKKSIGSLADGIYIISPAIEKKARPVPSEKETYSLFTKCLLESLEMETADLKNRGRMTIGQWYASALEKMVEEGLPEPARWADGAADNWVISIAAESLDETAKIDWNNHSREIKRITEMWKAGLVVPFIGSGALLEGMDIEDREAYPVCPLERKLAEKIAEWTNFPEDEKRHHLSIISQYCQMKKIGQRPLFYQQLKDLLTKEEMAVAPVHRILVQQKKPMVVVTTCYDMMLEKVFEAKKYAVVSHVIHTENPPDVGKVVVKYSDRPEEAEIIESDELSIDLDKWWVFYKIRGTFDLFIKDFTGKEEIDSIVISEEDYISFLSRLSDQHRTVPTLFKRRFPNRMMLFLGYHMNNWSLRTLVHILRKEESMRQTPGYAIRSNVTGFEKQYWECMNIKVIDMEVSEFVKELAQELNLRIE